MAVDRLGLWALLQDVAPEVVAIATAQEYALHGHRHGSVKALADIMFLKNLRNMDKYLTQYSSK